MKHIVRLSKSVPAKAAILEDHPSVVDSVKGFIEDPVGTVQLHFDKGQE